MMDSFSFALRAELKDTGVTVTCLMPGATETEFFERADMLDTKFATDKKQSASEVAELGFKAMMSGDGDVIPGHPRLSLSLWLRCGSASSAGDSESAYGT